MGPLKGDQKRILTSRICISVWRQAMW